MKKDSITFSEPKLLHGPGHLSHYYIYLLKNDEPISVIARGNTPQEVIENAEKLKERLLTKREF